MPRAAAAAAVFTAMLLAAPAAAGETGLPNQDFAGWHGGCRADGYCALTEAADARSGPVLEIGRHAESTYWEIALIVTPPELPDSGRAFTVAVDGKVPATFEPPAVAPYGAPNNFFFTGPGARGLIDRMVAGQQVRFGFATAAGQGGADFALAGLGAGLIWIDTLQGRIGSERVAEAPPVGLFRADVRGAAWMAPLLAHFQQW
jgi:hypothetical protein